MTKKLTLIFIVIIAVIIWMLLQKNQDKSNPIQVVSQETQQITEKPQQLPKANIKNIETEVADHMAEDISQPIENKLKELSYLQLYEKSLLAKDCYNFYMLIEREKYRQIYENQQQEIDYIKKFKDSIILNSEFRQQQATEMQIEAYQDYTEQCLALKSETTGFPNDMKNEKNTSSILEKIHLAMDEKEPVSDEGKDLKKALTETNQFKKNLLQIDELNKGISDLSQEELDQLDSDTHKINRKLNDSKFFGDEAKLSAEYLALKKELKDNQTYLETHLTINQQELKKQKDQFIKQIVGIESLLNTQYPSVFREVFNTLNFNYSSDNFLPDFDKFRNLKRYNIEFPIISEQIFEQSGIKDKDYFNQLLQPSLDLYQCYLGEDCTFQNSRRSANFCYLPKSKYLLRKIGLIFESCEMNLDDFYLQYYLTENQIEDMNVIFNYLVDNYAK